MELTMKDSLLMEIKKALAYYTLLMVQYMKVHSKPMRFTDLELINGVMEKNTQAIGKEIG
jgi:hypothetical protein